VSAPLWQAHQCWLHYGKRISVDSVLASASVLAPFWQAHQCCCRATTLGQSGVVLQSSWKPRRSPPQRTWLGGLCEGYVGTLKPILQPQVRGCGPGSFYPAGMIDMARTGRGACFLWRKHGSPPERKSHTNLMERIGIDHTQGGHATQAGQQMQGSMDRP